MYYSENINQCSFHSIIQWSGLIITFYQPSRINTMVSLSKLVIGASAVTSVFAAPPNFELDKRQTITTSQTGTNNGFYYSFWTNGGGTVDYTNGNAGEYSVTWQNNGDFTAGKGWNPGSAR